MQSTKDELQERRVKIDVVVRPIWKVGPLNCQEVTRADDITPQAALRCTADLLSGGRTTQVTVNVSSGALDVLRKKVSNDSALLTFKWAPRRGDIDEDMISLVVRSFLEQSLSAGGSGFWDAIRYPSQELDDAAMLRLLGESRAFSELRQAIDDALEPPLLSSFLKGLAARHVRINNFEQALAELSNMLGGGYQRGEVFSTSSSELFSRLRKIEQELLRYCYSKGVQTLLARFPHLQNEFSQLF